MLGINGKIFTGQGQAIAKNAASDVRVLVVGNPCNTNCLIAMNNAPDVPRDRWFAMTRLDENRAAAQLAAKANRQVSEVSNVTIWGNHSATQYPDYYNAKIGGQLAPEVISDDTWAHVDFIPTVQQRGAAIIQARGASSLHRLPLLQSIQLKSFTNPTSDGDWNSVCVASDGSYDTKEGLITSFPIRSDGENWEIVKGLPINDFAREKIDASVKELAEERELVSELLPS